MQTEDHSQTVPPSAPTRPKNTRPPLPENYKTLCRLTREGRLFEVQQWFKDHKYEEPAKFTSVNWPMGIAIEKGFHSMVEVLLQNGIPADDCALQKATAHRKAGMVDLLLQYGATVDMVDLPSVIRTGDRDSIKKFISRGADLVTGYPIATGLIRQTKLFLGIYKSLINEHPYLQFQADMALRHFCEIGNLRGVSLLMWLGADPRAKVPRDPKDSEDLWDTPLMTAAWEGHLDVIKRLKPDPSKDDFNALLHRGLYRRKMDLVRYWISLGADINSLDECGLSSHHTVLLHLSWALEPRNSWSYGTSSSDSKRFLLEWFSSGAKWTPKTEELSTARKVFSQLSYFEVLELLKLLIAKEVITTDALTNLLDTPKASPTFEGEAVCHCEVTPTPQEMAKVAA